MEITQSILLTVKKMLGVSEEYNAFDIDILTNINSVFLTLNQLGIGPDRPYQIKSEEETWQTFLGEQYDYVAAVQTYVYQKVRLLFDPPTNSFLVDAMQKSCQEFEWRFTVQPKNDSELSHIESYKKDDVNEKLYEDNSVEELNKLKDVKESDSPSITLKATPRRALYKKPTLYDIFS